MGRYNYIVNFEKKTLIVVIFLLQINSLFGQLLCMTPKESSITVPNYKRIDGYKIYYPKYEILLNGPKGRLYFKNELIYIDTHCCPIKIGIN